MYYISHIDSNNINALRGCIMVDNDVLNIPRKRLIQKIDELQDYYKIDMGKSIIEENSLPNYFNVKQVNNSTVIYNFEVDEGSAEIAVINFDSSYEFNEMNKVLESHIENTRKG